MNKTNITWCDYTWNPFTGCSNGCEYCYARKLYYRYGMDFTPQEHPDRLRQPLSKKAPSIIFLGSTGDITEDAISIEFVDDILEVIDITPEHTYMLLTKHPEKLYDKLYTPSNDWCARLLGKGDVISNLWLGVSITKKNDLWRADKLGELKGFKKFWSIEPMLEDISILYMKDAINFINCVPDLVIVGGVTPGKPLHETHPDWLRVVISWCSVYGIPVHYKHQGKNPEFLGTVWDAQPESEER